MVVGCYSLLFKEHVLTCLGLEAQNGFLHKNRVANIPHSNVPLTTNLSANLITVVVN